MGIFAHEYWTVYDGCQKLKYRIKQINDKYCSTPNRSKNEMIALRRLRNNKNIIIKAADKGGGIGVLNTMDYESKMLDRLNNTPAYIKVNEKDFNPLALYNEYLEIAFKLKPYLTNKQFNWLCDT